MFYILYSVSWVLLTVFCILYSLSYIILTLLVSYILYPGSYQRILYLSCDIFLLYPVSFVLYTCVTVRQERRLWQILVNNLYLVVVSCHHGIYIYFEIVCSLQRDSMVVVWAKYNHKPRNIIVLGPSVDVCDFISSYKH